MNKLQYLQHYTLPKFGNNLFMTFISFLNICTWKTFEPHDLNRISNFHKNVTFTMEEETNAELVFPDVLLKQHNIKISVLVYRKPT